jgi:hypothetical protein
LRIWVKVMVIHGRADDDGKKEGKEVVTEIFGG